MALPRRTTSDLRRPAGIERSHRIAVTAMFVAFVVHMAATVDVFIPRATALAMAVEYGILAAYMVIAGMRGQIGLAGVAAAFLAYLVWQSYLFGNISGLVANPLNAATYGTLALVLVVYLSRLRVGLVLTIFAIVCIVYLLYYAASWTAVTNYSGPEHMRGLLLSDGVRSARAYLAGQFAAFILFLGLAMLRRHPVPGLLCITVAGYAILIAISRLFQVMTAVVLVSAILILFFPFLRRPVAYLFTAAFVVLSLVGMWGYIEAGYNPYEILYDDSSGRARYYEYQDATRLARNHLLTGIGIAGSNQDLQYFARPQRPLYDTDLGMSGLVLTFGLPMTLIFMGVAAMSMLCIPNERERQSPLAMALFWTHQGAALGSFFTMAIFGGPGTLFFGMTLLLWLIGGYFEPLFPRRWERTVI